MTRSDLAKDGLKVIILIGGGTQKRQQRGPLEPPQARASGLRPGQDGRVDGRPVIRVAGIESKVVLASMIRHLSAILL